MKKHQCKKCKRFLPKKFFTLTGGDCPRCGSHVEPEWWTVIMENSYEIFGDHSMPMAPWSPFVTIYPDRLEMVGIYKIIYYHMGINFPRDMNKMYLPPMSDWPEYGPADITAENAVEIAGMQGVDMFHNALLITTGSCTESKEMAQVAANLLYYAATKLCVGGNHPLELRLESEIRNAPAERYPLLQDAVAYIFEECGLVHPNSVAYNRFPHPRF